LSDEEIAWKENGTLEYQNLAIRSLASQRAVKPLNEVQRDRPRFRGGSSLTLGAIKAALK
jgi:phenylacetic acid degradation protein